MFEDDDEEEEEEEEDSLVDSCLVEVFFPLVFFVADLLTSVSSAAVRELKQNKE